MPLGSHTSAATSPHLIRHVRLPFLFATSHLSSGESYYLVLYSLHLFSRYQTSNLLCTSIIPSPKEQNPDEIQQFLRPMVSDLLQLWRDGIKVPTESCPEGTQLSPCTQEDISIKTGHLVRVILVAVVCNKPATHKVGGFGSHSHTNFYTLCWISTHDKTKPATFK
jgi:hypothetical protein